MITIVDYGVGNLFSVVSGLNFIGADSQISSNPDTVRNAEKLLLPGVGAFADAAELLNKTGLGQAVKDAVSKGTPLLGICLGMQLLFDKSYEYGEHDGLGLIKGSVKSISDVIPADLKIPHIGWNGLKFRNSSNPLFRYINEGDCVYFVHSYYACDCDEAVIAVSEYGAELTAAVADKNIFGCQFHPEKSGKTGLAILKAFVDMKEEDIC